MSRSATVRGYTLVSDSPGLPREPRLEPQIEEPVAPCSETPILRGYQGEGEVGVERKEKSEDEEEDDEDISLDSLLKRSREYVKREQSQQGSNAAAAVSRTPPPETQSAPDEKRRSPVRNTGVEFGFSLHHSPVGPPPVQHHSLYDLSPQKPVCLSPSQSERYGCLPSPESSISPRPHRRRPRPVSTGNIHITFPFGTADLIPRSPGRSGEGTGMPERGEALSVGHCGSAGMDGVKRSANRPSSYCGISAEQEDGGPVSASGPVAQHEYLTAGFRRRCHTLDSQLNTYQFGAEHIDRSQERAPRFMAGVTRLAPSWRSPVAPLNQSYEVDDPSPSLLRPHVTPDFVTLRMEPDDPQGPNKGNKIQSVLRNTAESQASKAGESLLNG